MRIFSRTTSYIIQFPSEQLYDVKVYEKHKILNCQKSVLAWNGQNIRLVMGVNSNFWGEKKFNLEGPDGCLHYRRDLKKEQEVYLAENLVEVPGWFKEDFQYEEKWA